MPPAARNWDDLTHLFDVRDARRPHPGRTSAAEITGVTVASFLRALAAIWGSGARRVPRAAADEICDDRIGVAGGRPGDAGLARE